MFCENLVLRCFFNSSFFLQLSKSEAGSQAAHMEDNAEAQRNVGRDLFLWAVVQNNKELAEITWEQVIRKHSLLQTDLKSLFLSVCAVLKRSGISLYLYAHSVETACLLLWLLVRS